MWVAYLNAKNWSIIVQLLDFVFLDRIGHDNQISISVHVDQTAPASITAWR